MEVPQIKNLEQLFQLGSNEKIKTQKIQLLTAPGDNYGSLMLSVELTVESSNGKSSKNVYAVAKTVPPSEFLQQVFNTKVTFRNEIAFYKNIVPLLRNFQKENGVGQVIGFTPQYYGSRLNLNNSDEVDGDAALVLENLKVKNFTTLERTQGFDLETAKLVIANLAQLHAVSLGLKLKKPEVFGREIKPYLHGFQPDEKLQNFIKDDLIKVVDQIEELVPLKDRILAGFDKMVLPRETREPFATLLHNDCWINNIMLKFEGTVETKIVDYQLCSFGSPAKDILFFLFSSVKDEIIQDKYDEFLKMYHKIFLSVLEDLHCDTGPFGFEKFLQEIDLEAESTQFGHIAFMLIPIFAVKKDAQELDKMKRESMGNIVRNITDLHKRKFSFVVNEFVKRNWV